MKPTLEIRAGARALALVRERGLRPEDIDAVVAASGGPKWLAVAGLDRYLFGEIAAAPRARPLHLLGSSIGSWRMACLAQGDAVAALDRTHEAYLAQRYPARPAPQQVSATVAAMLDVLLAERGAGEILANARMRLHVLTTGFHGLLASERRWGMALGLTLAALGNAVARSTLALQMRRVVVHNAGDATPFRYPADIPTLQCPLDAASLKPALLASASLPLVMSGVRVPNAGSRVCMDGGFVDYHPAFDFGAGDGLVLYPHYYPYLVPGWFDKSLPWRRDRSAHLERVLLIAPSREFVAALPHGKIPDRDDFKRLGDEDRLRYWHAVMDASRRMGEELHELRDGGRLADRVRSL